VLCTNPAALARGGRSGLLDGYDRTDDFPGLIGALVETFRGPPTEAPTPWVRAPAGYSARCSTADGADFLRVTRRRDDVPVLTPVPFPSWGLHFGDVNLALGNLTALVGSQSRAWLRRAAR
jgi:hypothetical protein